MIKGCFGQLNYCHKSKHAKLPTADYKNHIWRFECFYTIWNIFIWSIQTDQWKYELNEKHLRVECKNVRELVFNCRLERKFAKFNSQRISLGLKQLLTNDDPKFSIKLFLCKAVEYKNVPSSHWISIVSFISKYF